MFNRSIWALAQAGVLGAKVTGIADGTDLETTEHYTGCSQVTRQVQLEDKRSRVHEIAFTVYGWKVLLLIDAVTKIALAVKVVPIQEHEILSLWALVTQARTNLGGHARLHYGPGGITVFLSNAPVDTPLRPFSDETPVPPCGRH